MADGNQCGVLQVPYVIPRPGVPRHIYCILYRSWVKLPLANPQYLVDWQAQGIHTYLKTFYLQFFLDVIKDTYYIIVKKIILIFFNVIFFEYFWRCPMFGLGS